MTHLHKGCDIKTFESLLESLCNWKVNSNVLMSIQGVPVSELAGKFLKFTFHLTKSVAVTQTRTCLFSWFSGGLCESVNLNFFIILVQYCHIAGIWRMSQCLLSGWKEQRGVGIDLPFPLLCFFFKAGGRIAHSWKRRRWKKGKGYFTNGKNKAPLPGKLYV